MHLHTRVNKCSVVSLLLLTQVVVVAAAATLATDLSNYYNNSAVQAAFKWCAAGHAHTRVYIRTHTHHAEMHESEAATEAPTTKFFHILWKLLYAFHKIVAASGKCARISTHTLVLLLLHFWPGRAGNTHVQHHKMADWRQGLERVGFFDGRAYSELPFRLDSAWCWEKVLSNCFCCNSLWAASASVLIICCNCCSRSATLVHSARTARKCLSYLR